MHLFLLQRKRVASNQWNALNALVDSSARHQLRFDLLTVVHQSIYHTKPNSSETRSYASHWTITGPPTLVGVLSIIAVRTPRCLTGKLAARWVILQEVWAIEHTPLHSFVHVVQYGCVGLTACLFSSTIRSSFTIVVDHQSTALGLFFGDHSK